MEPPQIDLSAEFAELETQYPMPSRADLAAGGTDMTVERLDGSSELVRVRIVGYDRMLTYLQFLQREDICIQIYCDGKDTAWVNSLTPESHDALVKEGQRLSVPLFLRWHKRYLERNRILLPINRALFEAAARNTPSPPTTSSPSSASAPGGAVPS